MKSLINRSFVINYKIIILLIPLILSIFSGIFSQWFLSSGNSKLSNFIYQGEFVISSVYFVILLFLCIYFYRFRGPFTKIEKFYLKLSIFFFFFSFISLSISIANENPLKYIVSDYLRSQVFFIVLTSLILFFNNKSSLLKETFLKYLLIITFFSTFVGFIGKLALMSSGTFYGGGLNQFIPAIHVLVILIVYFTKIKFHWKKLALFMVIFLLIAFTVLSLKRGNWVSLIFIFFALNFFIQKRTNLVILAISLLSLGTLFLVYFDLIESIVNRFMSTFISSNGYMLGNSSSARLAEIAGAIYTYSQIDVSLLYFVGSGNGALYLLNPDFLVETGRYSEANQWIHHSHPMFNVLFIRNGIIGILVYLSAILFLIKILFQTYKSYPKGVIVSNKYGIFFLAFGLEIANNLLMSAKSNAFYGSIYLGIITFAFIQSQVLFKKNLSMT